MKANLILFLVLCMLALGIWYLKRDLPAETLLHEQDFTRISLVRPGHAPLELTRKATSWHAISHGMQRARPAMVEGLMRLPQTAIDIHYPDNQFSNLDDLGLADKAVVIAFDNTTIRVGGSDPITHQRYVQHAGRVYLLKDTFSAFILANTESFLEPAE